MMKVIFHEDFYKVYTSDPAAAAGRMEAIVEAIESQVELVGAQPATQKDIEAAHTKSHIDSVRRSGLYDIAALAAGGAVQAAGIGLAEPAFGLIRPPGHHASADSAWGFCFFNNIAVALQALKNKGQIKTAYVLDIDLHYGDGTVNILGSKDYVTVHNVEATDRQTFLAEIEKEMDDCRVDLIGISAGFDNHRDDWGGLLLTEDYFKIGQLVKAAARQSGGGCFGILEGGYNHQVLGQNVMALIEGLSDNE
ncbi:MAG: histone deacetylase family protein [Desulfobacterales bacterium]